MLSKSKILGSLADLGLLLGVTSSIAGAQMTPVEMPMSASEGNIQFHRIEQPLGLKVGVTVGGIALIGLELWLVLFSRKVQGTSFSQRHDLENSA